MLYYYIIKIISTFATYLKKKLSKPQWWLILKSGLKNEDVIDRPSCERYFSIREKKS